MSSLEITKMFGLLWEIRTVLENIPCTMKARRCHVYVRLEAQKPENIERR